MGPMLAPWTLLPGKGQFVTFQLLCECDIIVGWLFTYKNTYTLSYEIPSCVLLISVHSYTRCCLKATDFAIICSSHQYLALVRWMPSMPNTCVHLCICIYVCICIYIYICVYIYIYIYIFLYSPVTLQNAIFSHEYSQMALRRSPLAGTYGESFVSPKSDIRSTFAIAMLFAILCVT